MTSTPRIALFSPVYPIKSGISDYTERLIPYLLDHFKIDLYVDGYQPVIDGQYANLSCYQRYDFEWQRRLTPYDLIFYQMGNNGHHQYIYPVLFRYPGLVTLHETNLHRARAFDLLNKREADHYISEMEYCSGDKGRVVGRLVSHGFQGQLIYDWFPFIRLVCESASHIVVHNRHAFEQVEKLSNEIDVTHIPAPLIDDVWQLEEEAKKALGFSPEAPIIAAFGFITPGKGLRSAVRAFGEFAKSKPQARFILVGECLDQGGGEYV